jgi:hypothetical protein
MNEGTRAISSLDLLSFFSSPLVLQRTPTYTQKKMAFASLTSSQNHKAIRTHGTLNFYSKRNILSSSARFSTLSHNLSQSYSP